MKKIFTSLKEKICSFAVIPLLYKFFLFFLLLLSIVLSSIIVLKENKQIQTLPSEADIQLGLEKTYYHVENVDCKYYDKATYNKEYYKYACHFDYQLENEEEKVEGSSSCVDCEILDQKWTCKIGSKTCFK